MIIRLVEQPIIAIHEAQIAGTVDGVVIKGNKVKCIYHRNMENQFAIPVENLIIGSDAVMIRDVTAMTLASQDVKPLKSLLDVYSISGKHLGCLQGIEADDQLVVRYIYTENYRIEMSKLVNYESVVVVDADEAELEACCYEPEACCPEEEMEEMAPEAAREGSASEEEEAITMEIGPEINWNHGNSKTEERSRENSELSVVRPVHHNEEKVGIPGVDPKYAYLCGKKLLEDIDIGDLLFEKGTVIDAELIKHAIGNNAIVKVIVSAEE